MSAATMLASVKVALRITHNKLNDEIQATIDAAKADIVRAGVSSVEVDNAESNPLIMRAIKTYCQSFFAGSVKESEGYTESYRYQLDNLRRSMRGAEYDE